MPASAAISATRSSCSGASTAKAPLTATDSHPAVTSRSTVAARRVLVEPMGEVEEGVLRLEVAARGEPDRADPGALARLPQVRLRAEPDHADAGNVALEQGVHRLRGREGDELDVCGPLAEVPRSCSRRRRPRR